MQVVSNACRVSRLLQSSIFLSSHIRSTEEPILSGLAQRNYQQVKYGPLNFFGSKGFYSSEVDNVEGTPTGSSFICELDIPFSNFIFVMLIDLY
jgi:hypothetical protein